MIEFFLAFMFAYGAPALIVGITAFFNVRSMIKTKYYYHWLDWETKRTTRGDVLGRTLLVIILTLLPIFNHFFAAFLVMGWLHDAWYKVFGEWSRTPV